MVGSIFSQGRGRKKCPESQSMEYVESSPPAELNRQCRPLLPPMNLYPRSHAVVDNAKNPGLLRYGRLSAAD
jgi:hypothetical protein